MDNEPELAAQWEAFAARLPAHKVQELVGLVCRTDDDVAHRVSQEEEANWLAVLRYLGMLPAAKVLHAHCIGMYINCNAEDCEGPQPGTFRAAACQGTFPLDRGPESAEERS